MFSLHHILLVYYNLQSLSKLSVLSDSSSVLITLAELLYTDAFESNFNFLDFPVKRPPERVEIAVAPTAKEIMEKM